MLFLTLLVVSSDLPWRLISQSAYFEDKHIMLFLLVLDRIFTLRLYFFLMLRVS